MLDNKNNDEIKKLTDEENNGVENAVDPMTFMTPEQAEENNKKAEAFIKAFRFGAPEFFSKIQEVYEVEGIKGLKRLEMSLDTYMGIRNAVISEVICSNPQYAGQASPECTETGEEDCTD